MAELDFEVTDEVDITDKVCPLTFVKAKVAIEELEDGEILAVRMNDGEPVQNVPRSMKEEGHKVLKLTDNEDGTYTMYVRAQNMQPSVFSQSFILRDPAYCSHTHGQKNHFHMQTVQSVTQCCQTARCQRKYHE